MRYKTDHVCIHCSCTNQLLASHDAHYGLQAAIQTPLGAAQGTSTLIDTGDSMILVAVLLCTLLRGVRMQESKIAALTLLTQAAMHCDDDTRLQRIVPYILVSLPYNLPDHVMAQSCNAGSVPVADSTDLAKSQLYSDSAGLSNLSGTCLCKVCSCLAVVRHVPLVLM